MQITRIVDRTVLFGLVTVGLMIGVAAAGGTRAVAARSSVPSAQLAGTSALQLLVTSTDLTLGRNRFTFGVLDNNHPLSTGQPQLAFYYVRGNSAPLMGRTRAFFNDFWKGLKHTEANSAAWDIKGAYVSHPRFSRVGLWIVRIRLRYKGRLRDLSSEFPVRRRSITPAVGSPAPRSHNPTIHQEPVSKLDSGQPPDDMHKLSIAQAIAQHKPLVVLFSTPAFCTSRMCAPQTQIVEQIEGRYRGRVNFVHIEIYKDADPSRGYAPTVRQWHLQTEPWVFVVNRRGFIAAKFEGPTSGAEIKQAIDATLRS